MFGAVLVFELALVISNNIHILAFLFILFSCRKYLTLYGIPYISLFLKNSLLRNSIITFIMII